MAVIVIHTSNLYCKVVDKSFYWYFAVTLNALSRFAVPMFFMISGMFLLKKKESLRDFFKKRFAVVFVPFFCWTCVYICFQYRVAGTDLWLLIYKTLSQGVFYHFWFVYALLGLYLLCPVLKCLFAGVKLNNKDAFYLFLVVFAIFAHYQIYFYPNSNRIFILNAPFVYFVAGYYVNFLSNLSSKLKYLLIPIAIIAFGCMLHFAIENEYKFYQPLQPKTPMCFAFTVSIFLLLYMEREKINSWLKKCEQLIVKLSSLTFGVYLCHAIIIEILKICWLKNNLGLFHGATVTFVALTALTMILSFALCYLLSLIPIVKKYFL